MTDFEYLKLILNKKYLCVGKDALIMVEDQGDEYQPHKVKIHIGLSISQVALYRFDEGEKGDFMPFFNSSHHKPKQADDAPKGLKAFCDYILLVEKHGVTYVVLVEMKRGSTAGAEQQLEAGELFMNYVVRSADRIKELNRMSHFNSKDITFRRVLLRLPVSPKQRTRPGYIRPEDRNGIIEYAVYANFHLNQIL